MQFSSLLLSATGLLAQAASGFYLLTASHPDLETLGYAKLFFDTTIACAVFHREGAYQYAAIDLIDGDIGNSFVLRKDDDGLDNLWPLTSRLGTSVQPGDITGPFEVDANNNFVYKGTGGGAWAVCDLRAAGHWIFYSANPVDDCLWNVTLKANKVE